MCTFGKFQTMCTFGKRLRLTRFSRIAFKRLEIFPNDQWASYLTGAHNRVHRMIEFKSDSLEICSKMFEDDHGELVEGLLKGFEGPRTSKYLELQRISNIKNFELSTSKNLLKGLENYQQTSILIKNRYMESILAGEMIRVRASNWRRSGEHGAG